MFCLRHRRLHRWRESGADVVPDQKLYRQRAEEDSVDVSGFNVTSSHRSQ